MTSTPVMLSSLNWFPKASAGLVLGLTLSFALMGILGLLAHADGQPRAVGSQFLMWLVVPVWTGILGTCFLFRSGWRAGVMLGGANAVLWAIYMGVRSMMS